MKNSFLALMLICFGAVGAFVVGHAVGYSKGIHDGVQEGLRSTQPCPVDETPSGVIPPPLPTLAPVPGIDTFESLHDDPTQRPRR